MAVGKIAEEGNTKDPEAVGRPSIVSNYQRLLGITDGLWLSVTARILVVMAEGKGSSASIVLLLLLSMLVFHSVHADTYTVGGALGWTSAFAIASWPDGKNFKAGDTLVFNYLPGTHNVMVVDENAYNLCQPLVGTRGVYVSRADRIQLFEGMNYFIDSTYCLSGMRMAINAAS